MDGGSRFSLKASQAGVMSFYKAVVGKMSAEMF